MDNFHDLNKDIGKFTTGKGNGMRFNTGKLRYDLVHPLAHEDMVKVLTDGAVKYAPHNWENGFSWTSVIASLKRHLSAIEKGEDYDPESGRLHISHAACNVHFLNAFYYIFPQGDDREKRFLKIPKIGIDVDGVIADFSKAWSLLYPDIDEKPNSWALDRKILERFDNMERDGVLDEFYLNIPKLLEPKDLAFEPYCYITSRPVSGKITEKWLDNNGFPAKKVYCVDIMKSKYEMVKESGIEIFVDDSFDNFVDLNNKGIFTYLYDAPWNRKHDVGHMRIKSLNDIPLVKF